MIAADGLLEAINQEFETLQSSSFCSELKNAPSREEMEARILKRVGAAKERVNVKIDEAANQIIAAIPENEDERREFATQVLGPFEKTLKLIEDYFTKALNSLVSFFKDLWEHIKNAVVWVGEKIVEGVKAIGETFKNLANKAFDALPKDIVAIGAQALRSYLRLL